jgi:succinyl-CoA synthetase alpha subunit
MAIFLTESSKLLVQGITGSEGTKHTIRMLGSHANIVAGVTPGKGGQTVTAEGRDIPVFNSCGEAVAATGADVSVVFVPPRFAKAAVIEAIDAAIPLVVVITEGIAIHDTAAFYQYAANSGTTRIVGPNCPGLISPGKSNAGIIPGTIAKAGRIGLVSKSGTLTYQMMYELRDLGFSSAVGIGGDPVIGTTHIDALAAFEADPDTEAIVMIGEIGGSSEEDAAQFLKDEARRGRKKPMVGFIAGRTAPPGRRMGHAGAIIAGGKGDAESKIAAMESAGIKDSPSPARIGRTLVEVLRG